jgi:glutamate/tyrosine decarboxylase-like PLP-dependent enzyme
MECKEIFNLQQLQDEIQPLLNKVLENSKELKEVLKKHGVLETAEFQVKLNATRLASQENGMRSSDQSQPRLDINSDQELQAACSVYCRPCGCFVACGDC